MSKKTKMLDALQGYKKSYEKIQQQLNDIANSSALTEEGKEQAKAKLQAQIAPEAQKVKSEVVEAIGSVLQKLNQGQINKEKLLDAGYQAGFANVLKMLELGAIKTEEDVKSIVATYEGDYAALAAIKAVLGKTEDPEKLQFAGLVPEDTRGKTKELLQKLQQNVETYVGTLGDDVLFGLDGMSSFVNDRLNDNLEVIA